VTSAAMIAIVFPAPRKADVLRCSRTVVDMVKGR
jgi:hypothetical protein